MVIKIQKTIVRIILFIICLEILDSCFAESYLENNTLSPISSSRNRDNSFNESIFYLSPEKYGQEFLKDIFSRKTVLNSLKEGVFELSDLNDLKIFDNSPYFYQLIINELAKHNIVKKNQIDGESDFYKIDIRSVYKYFVERRRLTDKTILKNILLSDDETFFLTIKEVLSKKNIPKRDMIFLCEIIISKFQKENTFNMSELDDVGYYLRQVVSGVTSYFADGALFLGHVIFFRNINYKFMEGISAAAEGVEPVMKLEERWTEASDKIIENSDLLANLFKVFDKTIPLRASKHIDVIADLFVNYFFITEDELARWVHENDISKLNASKLLQESIFYIKRIIRMQLEWFYFLKEIKGNKYFNKVNVIKLNTLMSILENEISISIVYGVEKFNNRTVFLERIKEIERHIQESS